MFRDLLQVIEVSLRHHHSREMIIEVENEMVILLLNVGVRRWADDHPYDIWRNPNLNHDLRHVFPCKSLTLGFI